ncbi:MAG: hypothetical protein AB7G17_14115 [Phycisphaerales bacterium]
MQGAATINFVIRKGRRWAPRLTSWINEADTAIVPSSYSAATFTIYDSDGATPLVTLTSGHGITLGSAAIDFEILSASTSNLKLGTYRYDMSLKGGDSEPFPFLRGVVTVELP